MSDEKNKSLNDNLPKEVNELSDEDLSNIGGGNALDDFVDSRMGKWVVSMCRNDVADALRDKQFTSAVENCNSVEDVKRLFDERNINVGMNEINIWYKGAKRLGFINENDKPIN